MGVVVTVSCFCLFCSPDVEFCGYNQPHPSENKIQFRIQTKGMIINVDVSTVEMSSMR